MINHESIKVVGCGTELLTRNLYHRVKPMVFSNSDGFCISGTTLPALSASASASASNKCGTMWIIFHPSLNNVYYSSVVLSDLEASTPPAEGWSTLVDGLLPSPKLEFMRDGTLEGHIKYKAMFNCPFLITSFPLVRTLSCGPREPLRERVVLKRKHRTCKTVKVEITTNDAGGELNTNECISPFQISYNISRCAPIVQEISTPMHPRVDLRILTSKNKQLRRQIQSQQERRSCTEHMSCDDWLESLSCFDSPTSDSPTTHRANATEQSVRTDISGCISPARKTAIFCHSSNLPLSPILSVDILSVLLAKQPAASTGLKGGSRRTPASTESIDFNRILFEIQLHVHERAEGACVAASGRCKTVRVCAAKLMRLQEQVTSLFRTVSVPAPIAPDWTNAGVILVTNSQQQQQPTAQMAAQCEGNDFDRSKQQEQESSREVFLLHLEEYLQSLLQLAAALKQQQLVLFPTLSDDPLSDSTRQLCREYLGLLHQVFPTLISL